MYNFIPYRFSLCSLCLCEKKFIWVEGLPALDAFGKGAPALDLYGFVAKGASPCLACVVQNKET